MKIDLDELCYALDDASYDNAYYLDLDTGGLLLISDYMDSEEVEELSRRLEEEPERYELLPKASSHEGYREMEEFIATVQDERLAELLEVAIDGKGAFRRFKDVLGRFPNDQERWFRFREQRAMERALEWLEEIGVRPIR